MSCLNFNVSEAALALYDKFYRSKTGGTFPRHKISSLAEHGKVRTTVCENDIILKLETGVVDNHDHCSSCPVWREGETKFRCYLYEVTQFENCRKNSSLHGILTPYKLPADDQEALFLPSGNRLFTLVYVGRTTLTQRQFQSAIEYACRARAIFTNNVQGLAGKEFSIRRPGFLFLPITAKRNGDAGFRICWEEVDLLNAYDFKRPTKTDCSNDNVPETFEDAVIQSRADTKPIMYYTLKQRADWTTSSVSKRKRKGKKKPRNGASKLKFQVTSPMVEAFFMCIWESSNRGFPVIPNMYQVVPVAKSTLALVELLPQWQFFLAFKKVHRRLSDAFDIGIEPLFVALTPKSLDRNASRNYERLEFLGDAVLNALISILLYGEEHERTVGELAAARSNLVSNGLLAAVSIFHDVAHTLAHLVSLRSPQEFEFFLEPQDALPKVSGKKLADVVEAIIGVVFVDGGFESAVKLFPFLGFSGHVNTNHASFHSPAEAPVVDRKRIDAVEQTLGYHFLNKALLTTSLIEKSCPNANSVAFARLCFLGKAMLSLAITNHIYKAYPEGSPGDLTSRRKQIYARKVLAGVGVLLGLHQHIYFGSKKLQGFFQEAVLNFVDGESSELKAGCNFLKVLEEALEALVGAMIVDSQQHFDRILSLVTSHLQSSLKKAKRRET